MSKYILNNIAKINKENFDFNSDWDYIEYYETSNVTRGIFDTPQILYKDIDKIPTRAKRLVNKNTIIYSSVRPNLEHVGIFRENNKKAVVSTGFITIDVDSNIINPYYLYLYLTQDSIREKMVSIASSSTSSYPSITSDDIGNLEIDLKYSIDIQNKFEEIISLIDSKIELNNRMSFELERLVETMYDFWFVQFEFPNEKDKSYKSNDGEMVWNEEISQYIPNGWETIKLGNILKKAPKGKKVLTSQYLEKGKIPVIDQSVKFIAGYVDDVSLIVESDEPVIVFGDHTRILKYINFPFAKGADGTQLILSNNERLPQILLYNTLKRIDLSNQGYARHFKFLKESIVLLPNKDIAKKFEKLVTPYFDKIKLNNQQNQELITLKNFIVPLLMNGKLSFTDI